MRDTAIRSVGCICCLRDGSGYVACEKHHLLTTGLHGNGRRRGEEFTIGLCGHHHRGEASGAIKMPGPSYADNARQFREVYGSDDDLLILQNELIQRWRSTFVVPPR